MTSRERIQAALDYRPVDIVPLRICPAAAGFHEHGQPLLDLIQACGHDFGDVRDFRLPAPPPPEHYDADGRFHAIVTDDWGTTWEYRIFGIWGHPLRRPLDDWANLAAWRPPTPPEVSGPIDAAPSEWFRIGDGGMLFERLRALRRFEDVLMDLALETPELGELADRVNAHNQALAAWSLAHGADAVAFGDDLGTASAPMISLSCFRRFFAPRYRELFGPIKAAGRRLFFHSCGQVMPLLADLRALGVDAIWPQLPLYDLPELARRVRDLGLSIELHPDRGELLQRPQPPGTVRDYLLRLVETFDVLGGGSWLYLEVDPGFLWDNVVEMFETAAELRRGG
jgi:hypothetical protein